MSQSEDRSASGFEADRADRLAARRQISERYRKLTGAYADKGIGSRLGDVVVGKAKTVADDAVEVARESKGILAGTAGLIGLWFLRKPIASQAKRLWPKIKARLGKENTW